MSIGSGTSLRLQIILLVAALVVPLLALQGWWSYRDFRGARQRAELDALAFADATALGVVQFFRTAEGMLEASAGMVSLDPEDPAACEAQMRDVVAHHPFLRDAAGVVGNGSVLCSARGSTTEGPRPSGWGWWDEMVVTRTFTLGDPTIDASGEWILPLAAPALDDDGQVVGAVVGTVALVELSMLFGGVTIPDDHLVTVGTAEQIVVARSQDAETRVGSRLPELTEGGDQLVAPGRWVATGVDLNGIPRTWGQVEIEPDWIVYVGVPDANVYGPAKAESLRNVAATLLVLLLGVLIAAGSYSRIAHALRELTARTKTLASGETVALPFNTPTEVRAVVTEFNRALEDRHRAEASERRTRERVESLFNNAVVGLYLSTPDGRFLQVNRALVEMLGFDSAEALIKAGPSSLYHRPEDRDSMVAKALDSGTVSIEEVEWVRADGVSISIRLSGSLMIGPDGTPIMEMIAQDITAERRTEEQLRQTQKMEAVGQLAGGIAHDFNNLLTVIGGNVELIEEELPESDVLRDDLHQISKATARATSLTGRLLSFSRRDRDPGQVVDVTSVIPELQQLLIPLIGESISLRTDIGDGPLPIAIDLGELEQALVNLVLNARDAMPNGGTLTISARRHTPSEDVEAGLRGDGVTIAVEDTGVGIDPRVRERIFEPFFTTKPMGHGTGLGLSTVYGIVQRSGGHLDADSHVGGGTTMSLWFPLADEARLATATPEHERGPVGTERVLVVEDDELVRRFVVRALQQAGYATVSASSGLEAADHLRVTDEPFDLVLTDVVMAGLSGPELAERLPLMAPGTPVLFMSGYLDGSPLSLALRAYPETLLRKPFTSAQLRHRVREAIDRVERSPTGP